MKCDETKPSCLRCVRFGHQCDGYTVKAASAPNSPKASRALIPKTPSPISPKIEESTFSLFTISPLPTPVKIYPAPPKSVFKSPQEYQAFQRLCQRTSHHVSSEYSLELWTRLMLQACETFRGCETLRYILDTATWMETPSTQIPRSETCSNTRRRQVSFRERSRSSSKRSRSPVGDCSIKTSLTGFLLFHNISSVQTDGKIRSEMQMVRDWIPLFCNSSANAQYLPRVGHQRMEVEEDLFLAFDCLNLQVMLHLDRRTKDTCRLYRQETQVLVQSIPPLLQNLSDARSTLELVIKRSMYWLRSTIYSQDSPVNLKSGSSSPISNFPSPTSTINSSPTSTSSQINTPPSSCEAFLATNPTLQDRLTTLTEYSSWDTAFKPLLNHSRSRKASEEDFHQASMLRMLWLAGYIFLSGEELSPTLVDERKLGTEIEEMLGIARILLQASTSVDVKMEDADEEERTDWLFDTELLIPLLALAQNLRNLTLRGIATRLISESPSASIGLPVNQILPWLFKVEAEGAELSGGYIAPGGVAKDLSISFDPERRETKVGCSQLVKGSPVGEEVRKEVVIPW